jgi:hypothetical protein
VAFTAGSFPANGDKVTDLLIQTKNRIRGSMVWPGAKQFVATEHNQQWHKRINRIDNLQVNMSESSCDILGTRERIATDKASVKEQSDLCLLSLCLSLMSAGSGGGEASESRSESGRGIGLVEGGYGQISTGDSR